MDFGEISTRDLMKLPTGDVSTKKYLKVVYICRSSAEVVWTQNGKWRNDGMEQLPTLEIQ